MARQAHDPLPLEERYVFWLSEVARTTSKDEDIPPGAIAVLAGVSLSTVVRWLEGSDLEKDERRPITWPDEVDRIMAAIAQLAGIEDPRRLWSDAFELWRKRGAKPRLQRPTRTGERVLDAVRRQTARAPSRGAHDAKSKPTRKRPAAEG